MKVFRCDEIMTIFSVLRQIRPAFCLADRLEFSNRLFFAFAFPRFTMGENDGVRTRHQDFTQCVVVSAASQSLGGDLAWSRPDEMAGFLCKLHYPGSTINHTMKNLVAFAIIPATFFTVTCSRIRMLHTAISLSAQAYAEYQYPNHVPSATASVAATRNNRTSYYEMELMTTQHVPQQMFFTMSINSMLPPVVYSNVQSTIDTYRMAWGNPNANVTFLDDAKCLEMIEALEPRLIGPFRKEKGAHKADICRVAALYLEGGYYFDLDLKAIHAVMLPAPSAERDIGFVSVLEDKRVPPFHDNIFQAFLASRPRHPILRMALNLMVEYYEGTRKILGINMGTSTMKMAIDAVSDEDRRDVLLLQEMQNLPKFDDWYPDLPPQKGDGCCCDFIVHDPDERKVFFWSHVAGWGNNCIAREESR